MESRRKELFNDFVGIYESLQDAIHEAGGSGMSLERLNEINSRTLLSVLFDNYIKFIYTKEDSEIGLRDTVVWNGDKIFGKPLDKNKHYTIIAIDLSDNTCKVLENQCDWYDLGLFTIVKKSHIITQCDDIGLNFTTLFNDLNEVIRKAGGAGFSLDSERLSDLPAVELLEELATNHIRLKYIG